MAETVSDKDVEQARGRVSKLRNQVAEEKSKASVHAAEQVNAVRVAQLEREEDKLKDELAALKEASKIKVSTEPAPVLEPAGPEVDTSEEN